MIHKCKTIIYTENNHLRLQNKIYLIQNYLFKSVNFDQQLLPKVIHVSI